MSARSWPAQIRSKRSPPGEQGAQPFWAACAAAAPAAEAEHSAELYTWLRSLLGRGPQAVLELGCGAGEIARGLAADVDHVDAVDASAALLARGRALPGGEAPSLHWHCCSAERFGYPRRYALALAAPRARGLDWARVVERLAPLLDGPLVLVLGRRELDSPWAAGLAALLAQFGADSAQPPADWASELATRALFRPQGRHTTAPLRVRQSLTAYVESVRARRGLARERMAFADAVAFDVRLAELLRPHARRGLLELRLATELACGWLLTAAAGS